MEDCVGADRLAAIRLDARSLPAAGPQAERERQAAIRDMVADNVFRPVGGGSGPYELDLSLARGRLVFAVSGAGGETPKVFDLRLTPFMRTVRDYLRIIDSYEETIRTASVAQIEAVDSGRRSLHDDAAERLRARLASRVEIDKQTARRLFTLICALLRRDGPA